MRYNKHCKYCGNIIKGDRAFCSIKHRKFYEAEHPQHCLYCDTPVSYRSKVCSHHKKLHRKIYQRRRTAETRSPFRERGEVLRNGDYFKKSLLRFDKKVVDERKVPADGDYYEVGYA